MKKILIVGLSLFLTACATPYQSNSFSGGYSELQINDDMYKVSYNGNGYTPKDKVAEMLLRRSAELTKQNGYKYFYILSLNIDTQYSSYTTPTTINTINNGSLNGYGYGSSYGYGNNSSYNMNYNGSYNGSSTTTINQGQTYTSQKHIAMAIIKMSNKKMNGAVNAQIYLNNFVNKK